jgi:FkbM family methyltransferase
MLRDNWVRSLGLDVDGSLFVDTDSGIRLYDSCLQHPLPATIRISPADLMKPEYRQLYYRFLITLKEIESVFIHSIYDSYRAFSKGNVVVDAGARIGAFAAKVSAAIGKEGRIIAIEPEPRNFACLCKNIEANRLNNIVAVQKALWSQAQPLDLFLSGNDAAHSVHRDPFYSSTGDSICVEADTLDSILAGLDMTPVDFIKMDIEGSEIEAIKGMQNILKSRAELAIAAYHPVDGKPAYTAIGPQLEQMGYEVTCADGIVHAHR